MHSSDPGVGEAEGEDLAGALVQLWGLAPVPQPASQQGETADKLQSVCNAVARGALHQCSKQKRICLLLPLHLPVHAQDISYGRG